MNTFNEKIIIANDLINGNRFVTKKTLENGFLVNYDVYTPTLLIASLVGINNRMISNREASYIILNLIKSNDYGLKQNVLTVGAASKVLEAINDYRMQDNYEFKNILKVNYNKLLSDYKIYLISHNLFDYIYGIDYIIENDIHLNKKAYLLNDLILSKKEEAIINFIFNDNVEYISMDKTNYKITNAYSCYGIYNELLNVLDIIEKNNYALSDCEIVYTNSIYENLIRGLFDARKINYSISNAHARSTNLISFILDVLVYYASDFKYELLEDILKNKGLENVYLKEFYETLNFPKVIVGFGKERTKLYIESIKDDESKSNIKMFLTDLIDCYDYKILDYTKLIDFSYKYIKANNEKKQLREKLNQMIHIVDKISDNVIKSTINEIGSLLYSEADSNSILVSPISKRLSIRPNLFIIGLSQNYVSGSDIENPFIIDTTLYEEELHNEAYLHLVKNKRNNIIDNLNYYLDYSTSNNIYLSYASFNKIDLRPSAKSVFFMEKTKGMNVIEVNKYNISKDNIIFKPIDYDNYNENIDDIFDNGVINEIVDNAKHTDIDEMVVIKNNMSNDKVEPFRVSPSAIKEMLSCPYKYYYKAIKKLPDAQYPKLNEHEWLENNTRGTFFHNVVELYAKKELKKENYSSNLDDKVFDESFMESVESANKTNVTKNVIIHDKEIIDMQKQTYDYITKLVKTFNEEKYRVLDTEFSFLSIDSTYKKDGICIVFTGQVDRIDGFIDENKILHLRVVDYKTGNKNIKSKKDISYIQHIIYPYVLVNTKSKLFNLDYDKVVVDNFIYDYVDAKKQFSYSSSEIIDSDEAKDLFLLIDNFIIKYLKGEEIFSKYDEYFNDKTKVVEKMSKFTSTICDYCTFKGICIKRLKEGKEWEKNTKKN